MHLAIYRCRADVQAIVHCHSPYATAWSCLGEPLEPITEEFAYFGLGNVRTTRRVPAGSPALATVAARGLGDALATLLGGHGTVAVGPDLESAATVARVIEHQARIAWLVSFAHLERALPRAGELAHTEYRELLREGLP